jgi:hypothetical protein
MNSTMDTLGRMPVRRGGFLGHFGMLCCAVALGAAAGFGIVKATDGGPVTVTRYNVISISAPLPAPDYLLYLVRDQAQADSAQAMLAEQVLAGSDFVPFRIVIAGTPEQAIAASIQIEEGREAGGLIEVHDLRSEGIAPAQSAGQPALDVGYNLPGDFPVAAPTAGGIDEETRQLLEQFGYR